MRPRIIIYLLLVIVLGFPACQSKLIPDLSIGLGFLSKEFCSCHFVLGNNQEFCSDYVKQGGFKKLLKLDVLLPRLRVKNNG